jgi:hypothetical protein
MLHRALQRPLLALANPESGAKRYRPSTAKPPGSILNTCRQEVSNNQK